MSIRGEVRKDKWCSLQGLNPLFLSLKLNLLITLKKMLCLKTGRVIMKILNLIIFVLCFGYSDKTFADHHVDLSDVGDVYLENQGAAEAQQAFLHGLAQLHNFEYEFAAKDFQDAQRIDPSFALAYWGEAMTYNHTIWMEQDKTKALKALNRYAPTPEARQAKATSELVRDLLRAVDVLYGPGTKDKQDDLYLPFMKSLFAKYPDNVEIASFYALSIMGSAHEGREFSLYMQSAALMQEFFINYPRHPGVAHYLIHATDDPIHAPLGLKAANAYGDIAPNAGHAQHMTTHIFLALGDWEGVIRANIRASGITNANRASKGKGPSGCGHYPSWLMYGYLQTGKRNKAYDLMALCYQNVVEDPRGYNYYYYAWQRALYLIDTDEWDGDVAKMMVDFKEEEGPHFENLIMDGWVTLKTGDLKKSLLILNAAKNFLEGKDDKEAVVQIKQLEAQILLAQGDNGKALELLREAVEMEMELPFGFGPPQPAKPSVELLAETLIALGQKEEARDILTTALSRTPNKTRIMKALETLN